jgi:prephenate dehydrogenase
VPGPDRAAAAASLPDRIAFLGLGLIGGSVALALRAAGGAARLVAWSPSGRGPAEALRRGVIDEVAPTQGQAIDGAGLIILAGPPLAIMASLRDLTGPLQAAIAGGATLTDVASTKGLIVATAEDLRLPFVGGHPMAGRETTGVGAASAGLFEDRPWVVVPGEGASQHQVQRVEALATAAGARPVRMTSIDHDLAVAAISHLPLIAAAALVEAVAGDRARWPASRDLAAGGWRDMTRLARGDPEMGAGILATNARPIAGHLRAYRDAIDGWLAALEGMIDERVPVEPGASSVAGLRARLEAARIALDLEPPA